MKKYIFLLAAILCASTMAQAKETKKQQQQSEFRDALKGFLLPTDSKVMKSLNGQWMLKVTDGIENGEAALSVPQQDDSWEAIPVPGCWETYGRCKPKYDYPDSITGYYRTSFSVPAQWRKEGRVVLRLDGVLRGYHLFVNEQYVGTWESAYNTCLWDITDFLVKGESQQLSMRVYSRFMGYEFDCFDDWVPMGIFRDVTLLSIPSTHLSDMKLETTRLQQNGGSWDAMMTMKFMAGATATKGKAAKKSKKLAVEATITDATGKKISSEKLTFGAADTVTWQPQLKGINPWTAETPYLYNIEYSLIDGKKTLQTFRQKFGIRQLTIEGNIAKINGQQVKFRGVNAHSTDPQTVKVISDELTKKDLELMKRASINYIRTSHYPREPHFFDLCDSLGFYVVCEVPFGRGEKNLSKKAYKNILLTRAAATVSREKNRACVMIWSVGNENPLTAITEEVGQYVQQLDHSRPMCYPQVGSYFRKHNYQWPAFIDIYAPHYPKTGEFAGFYQGSDRPQLFTEYCHTLGISFEDHDRQWEIIQNTDCMMGGSVWEWADQGMPFKEKLTDRYGYEQRVFTSDEGGFEMCGNKGTDGLLYANRVPLPNYYELQHNYARAAVVDSQVVADIAGKEIRLAVRNRYDFIDLKDNVFFRWKLSVDRDTVAQGLFTPDCPAHATRPYTLAMPHLSMAGDGKITVLNIEIADKEGRVFNRQALRLDDSDISKAFRNTLDVETEALDVRSQNWYVRLGRKATMCERLTVKDTRVERYLLLLNAKTESAKTESVNGKRPATADVIAANVKSEEIKAQVKLYNSRNSFRFEITPDTTGNRFLSEVGIAFLLPPSIDRVQWIGQGPFASYPGRYRANRYGLWQKRLDDLYLEGNRMGVDVVWLSDSKGNGYILVCDSGNVNFEQTDEGLVVTCNACVSGEGPKFGKTAFPVWAAEVGTAKGEFCLYPVSADNIPDIVSRHFRRPATLDEPFHPFKTQYDTYLMHLKDIVAK